MTKIFVWRPRRSSDQFQQHGVAGAFRLDDVIWVTSLTNGLLDQGQYLASLVWNALSRSTISPASSMMASLGFELLFCDAPLRLAPGSPNWSETTTTASHFTTHGGTYQRDDYRPVEPATGRGDPDNSIRSRCGSSRTDGVVRRVTASSPTPPNARTRKPPRPALNSTPSEPTPRRTDSCN